MLYLWKGKNGSRSKQKRASTILRATRKRVRERVRHYNKIGVHLICNRTLTQSFFLTLRSFAPTVILPFPLHGFAAEHSIVMVARMLSDVSMLWASECPAFSYLQAHWEIRKSTDSLNPYLGFSKCKRGLWYAANQRGFTQCETQFWVLFILFSVFFLFSQYLKNGFMYRLEILGILLFWKRIWPDPVSTGCDPPFGGPPS